MTVSDICLALLFALLLAGVLHPPLVAWMPLWARCFLGAGFVYYACFWLILKLAQNAPLEPEE